MAYQKDGSSHRNGIENEHECIEIINSSGLFPHQEHMGGTSRLNDSTHFSLKRHQSGTIDFGNLSLPLFKDLTDEAHNKTDLLTGCSGGRSKKRKWKLSFQERCELKETVRKIQHEAVRKAFELLEDNMSLLADTLKRALIHRYKKADVRWIGINSTDNQTLYIFTPNQHPVHHFLELNYTPVLIECTGATAKGQSKMLAFIDEKGNLHATDLRIRLTFNQGVSGPLGVNHKEDPTKKAQNHGRISLKIQQDKLDSFLNSGIKCIKLDTKEVK